MSDGKTIAKNTVFLYFRMFLIMGVGLYTSRVVIHKLGVDDYALYSVVGGVVGMLSFINGTLSIGTMRFLTFELGKNDYCRLHKTFNTAFYTHLALALILAVILETAGLWYFNTHLVIAPERFHAALIAYHISILSSVILVTQVPYTSLIMAYERMNIYAYISIFEAVAKLVVVYLLCLSDYDKLVTYAILIAVVELLTAMSYRFYCIRKFKESHLGLVFERDIFKSLLSFSGWNILANLSETLKLQGYIILLNQFFIPAVVAAQTIGNQVSGAMMQFINNFRSAINPQIIKQYASGDYEESKRLMFKTTVLVFDLVLLLGLPTVFVMDTIMDVWLVEIPPYAVVFTQYIIIQRILSTFDAAFYIPMMAASKIKSNSIIAAVSGPGAFAALYLIYRFGGDVMWMQYIGLIIMILFGFIVKPYLLVHDVEGYRYRDFIPCFVSCGKVALLSVALSYGSYLLTGNDDLVSSVILFILSILSVCLSSYLFLDADTRRQFHQFVASRIPKRKK